MPSTFMTVLQPVQAACSRSEGLPATDTPLALDKGALPAVSSLLCWRLTGPAGSLNCYTGLRVS